MFSKLAFRNIKRSFKDYAIYFFTLVLGVAIFYVFNALESQSVMLGLSDYMLEIVKLMNNVLSGVSVFVALVLGFLIIYASRFLIKRRSQEFGTYMVLGMGKKRISMIILLETLLIGVISLTVGLLIGVVISQLVSALVANMFEADMTKYRFVFSGAACAKTLLYFVIIFLVVMLLDTFMIARQRLIKLLQARRMTETVKIRKTWLVVVAFALGVALLVWAYSMVTVRMSELGEDNIIFVLAAGAIGTALFFWSFATIVIKLLQKTPIYNHGLNTFTLRQFSSAINTSAVAMTVICLMLFVTICVSVSAISLHESMMADIDRAMPIDIELPATLADGTRTTDALKVYDIDLPAMMSEQVEYDLNYSELTYHDILTDTDLSSAEESQMFSADTPIPIMHLSDYNAVAELFGNERIQLRDDQYIIVANFAPMVDYYNQALAAGAEIALAGKTLSAAKQKVELGAYQLSNTAETNIGLVVIPDNITLADTIAPSYIIGNFKDEVDAAEFSDKLLEIRSSEAENGAQYVVETKQMLMDGNIGINAIVTFVALYLGVIFLIASAALLALKQLIESSDNKAKYAVLQKLGASNRMINHALGMQIGIFFALPLIVAIIHAVFGIVFCNYILEIFGGIKIGYAVIGTGAVFLIIYGGYFWLTYSSSKRIVKERRLD